MQHLLEQGIATRRGIMLAHRETAFGNHRKYQLPKSEAASDASLLLPVYPAMSETDVMNVAGLFYTPQFCTPEE
jgi:dTDP-4-amino-4,6-dideoxygalactose transaminase